MYKNVAICVTTDALTLFFPTRYYYTITYTFLAQAEITNSKLCEGGPTSVRAWGASSRDWLRIELESWEKTREASPQHNHQNERENKLSAEATFETVCAFEMPSVLAFVSIRLISAASSFEEVARKSTDDDDDGVYIQTNKNIYTVFVFLMYLLFCC